jgi:hypothetical protein
MEELSLLRELFDQKIIEILNTLMNNPDKKLSLTQVSSLSKINVATAMRILNKLVEQDYVDKSIIGSSKTYQLKRNSKANILRKLLNKEKEGISEFIEKATKLKEIEKLILESESELGAKIIIVSSQLVNDKIEKIIEKIKSKNNFSIETMIINQNQFNSMTKLNSYNIKDKIIWQKPLS